MASYLIGLKRAGKCYSSWITSSGWSKRAHGRATCHRDALLGQANVACARMVNEALKAQKEIIDQARSEGIKVKEALLAQAIVEISKQEERSFQIFLKYVWITK